VRVCLAVVVVGVLAAASSASGVVTGPPVIHEPFTALPCPTHPYATTEIEGCKERALLASDRKLNVLAKRAYGKLMPSARRGFVRSEEGWLEYRRRSCRAQASPSAGGTANGIEFLACELQRNASHRTDLKALLAALSVH